MTRDQARLILSVIIQSGFRDDPFALNSVDTWYTEFGDRIIKSEAGYSLYLAPVFRPCPLMQYCDTYDTYNDAVDAYNEWLDEQEIADEVEPN